jgi:glucosyl-dolichyl phosphate glucuronosyltransferase
MLKLSVIIPTRNRCDLLKKTLSSIVYQSISKDKFEVIVIDNGSNDDTKKICLEYKGKIKNFQYEYIDIPGLHIGRHKGLEVSKSDILVYGDDDIIAEPSWLEAIFEAFEDEETVLVGGNNLPIYESEPPDWVEKLWTKNRYGRFNLFYSLIDFNINKSQIDPHYIFGCNFSIRKKTLLDAKGFHPDGMPNNLLVFRGDGESSVSDFILNNDLKAVFVPEATVGHWVSRDRMNMEYMYYRGLRQGYSDSYTVVRENPQIVTRKLLLKYFWSLVKFKIKAFFVTLLSQYSHMWFYQSGYRMAHYLHVKNLLKKPYILKWILKEDYFDYKLPEL